MKKSVIAVLVFVPVLTLLVFACKKKSSGDENSTVNDEFKKKMLINYADNIIIPAYTELQTNLLNVEAKIEAFLNSPSQTTLDAIIPDFKNAYLSYEKTSVAYFGPAATPAISFNNRYNSFPATISKIETAIQSGTYNFNLSPTSDSLQGFPALDYLLFSADALQKFSDVNAPPRKKYVRDVLAQMNLLLTSNLSQWNGNYRENFINSLKTNVGSSIGSLVNQFAFEIDVLKGPRIGWPFGKQSNGIVFADKCEGYFSGTSKELAIANLASLKNYFTGGSGDGISDYLVLLKKDQLNNDVLAQFDVALAALNAIPGKLSDAFTQNATQVETAYKEVQILLTLLKTNVASATAVQITYMDNDGD